MNSQHANWQDVELSAGKLDEARFLIEDNLFEHRRALGFPAADRARLTLAEADDALLHARGTALATRVGGRLAGLLVLADLPWESRILGKRMGVVKLFLLDGTMESKPDVGDSLLRRAIARASANKMQFLLCKVLTDDHVTIHALQRNSFLLVETVLNYVYDCRTPMPEEPTIPGIVTRRAEPADLNALLAVARCAFQDHIGRFHADPKFSRKEAVRIYEEWIRSSCAGYADAIFLAERGSEIGGFSVWKDPSTDELAAGIRCAHYSIGAVAPAFQRRGLFRALSLAGMHLYHERAALIDGPTNLRNTRVQRAYDALGWELRDSQYTFHRWL